MPASSFTGELKLKQGSEKIEVVDKEFGWELDSTSGLIVPGRVGDKTIVAGGAVLFVDVPLHGWKATAVKAEEADGSQSSRCCGSRVV